LTTQDERQETMSPGTIHRGIAASRQLEVTELFKPQATVLVATNDVEIRECISELLQLFPLRTVWAKGLEEVKSILARESITACFCGFWLVDGTYRDVVRHLKLQPVEIPAIIVCAPSCPHEYRDYLAALNIRAFDFICHPYRKTDMERILRSAIDAHDGSERLRVSSTASSTSMPSLSGLRRAS
jgi:DNA-binding NtrC family response regulator